MNLLTLFATSAANFMRVIGRRMLVKSLVGIYGDCKFNANWQVLQVLPLIARVDTHEA
jgi:hypothetical protein